MRAAFYNRTGPAKDVIQIGTLETPEPGPGEVLVRLHASGVNPSDVKARGGTRAGHSEMPFPTIIPHSDGAGVIEAVGPGSNPARVGERVWVWNGQWQRAYGTAAEYIAVPSAQAVRLPETTSFEEGACLGIPAMTAYQCVFGDGPVRGHTLLVTGGAGTVSRYAIQLGRLGGARVITTVSSAEKANYASQAGADHVFDYTQDDVAASIQQLTSGRGVDRVIDLEFGANLALTSDVIRPHGTIVTYGSAAAPRLEFPFYNLMFKAISIRTVLVYILTKRQRTAAIHGLSAYLEAGVLTHSIAQVFDINDAVHAHEFVEAGKKMGCVVLSLDT